MAFTMKDSSSSPFAWVLEGATIEAFESSGESVEAFADTYVRNVINGANYSNQSDDDVFADWAESGEREELIAYLTSKLTI